MTFSRRPGVPPKPAPQPKPQPAEPIFGDAAHHLEALAASALTVDQIVADITRRRAGNTNFVDAVVASEDDIDLSFLDRDVPPVNLPHTSVNKARTGKRY